MSFAAVSLAQPSLGVSSQNSAPYSIQLWGVFSFGGGRSLSEPREGRQGLSAVEGGAF